MLKFECAKVKIRQVDDVDSVLLQKLVMGTGIFHFCLFIPSPFTPATEATSKYTPVADFSNSA